MLILCPIPPNLRVHDVISKCLINLGVVSTFTLTSPVFSQVDEYAPGFSDSVVGYDALAPPDLERIFGLTGGDLSHLSSLCLALPGNVW